MTKDYYKETEYLLYNYKMFEISIENMEQEIEYLEKEDGMTGISYDGISTSPTHKFSSITEDAALSNSEKIQFLQRNIERNRRQLEKIDRAMMGLSEVERIILEQKYIEGKQWWQVAHKAGYSERQCRNIRKDAINKMIIGIFGDKALK
ncbi:hypothetical protein CIW83_18325 [Tissierella sp. P1]|uniref:hypothetical protein n=1 Tax=Tissierella sp. P1 TaxID=1280483 RepID=UPI000BA05578|nr:hypothetical protein [Tissierella sp. P1]OZV10776.1 hypothetical protein CIW83_18325 [Tissierella sp. P1]